MTKASQVVTLEDVRAAQLFDHCRPPSSRLDICCAVRDHSTVGTARGFGGAHDRTPGVGDLAYSDGPDRGDSGAPRRSDLALGYPGRPQRGSRPARPRLRGPAPGFRVGCVDHLIDDGSDRPMPLRGRAVVEITLSPRPRTGTTAPPHGPARFPTRRGSRRSAGSPTRMTSRARSPGASTWLPGAGSASPRSAARPASPSTSSTPNRGPVISCSTAVTAELRYGLAVASRPGPRPAARCRRGPRADHGAGDPQLPERSRAHRRSCGRATHSCRDGASPGAVSGRSVETSEGALSTASRVPTWGRHGGRRQSWWGRPIEGASWSGTSVAGTHVDENSGQARWAPWGSNPQPAD